MRKINAIAPSCLLLCAAATGLAQTQVDLGRQGKSPDFGAASSTRPAKTGALLPATCSTGELFFKSDAPAGQNLYGCTAPNTWTLQSSGTSSGEANTASTTGGGTFHWFAQKLGVDLQFKSFDVSSPISISESSNRLTFSCPTCIVSGTGYSDPSWITALAGSKIVGNISGSAVGFTGSLGGDVSGGQAATVVGRIQGRPVASTSPADGESLVWSATGNQWQPGTVSGSGGVSSAADLNDFKAVRTSGSLLTVNGGCSAVKPCVARFGNKSYAFTTSATATINGGSGQAFLYLDPLGTIVIGHSGLTISCAGCVSQNGITQFPADSLPLFIWSATSGSWDDSGADFRSFLSAKQVTAGTGVVVTEASGIATVAVDTAVIPQYSNGAGAPSGSCTAGQSFYLDTTNHNAYYCTNTNNWEQIDAAGGTGSPGGTTAAVQFHDGTGFGGDATNFAWDNTGKRLTAPLRDKGGQVYNVKAYGAVGDYTADDTAAIQAAIDAAATAPGAPAWAVGGGVVYFPPGSYRITSPLTLKSGVTLRGASDRSGSSEIVAGTASAAMVQDQGVTTETTNAGIEDLVLNGDNGASYGLHLRHTSLSNFRRVRISFTKSLGINAASGSHNKFEKVHVVSCREGALFGQYKWQANKAYATSRVVIPTTTGIVHMYEATTGGTSGGSEPSWPTTPGNTVVDGTVTWTCRDLAAFTNSYAEDVFVYSIAPQFTVSGTTVTISGADLRGSLEATDYVFTQLSGGSNNTLHHAIRRISNIAYGGGNTTFTIDSALDDRTGGWFYPGSELWTSGFADNLLFIRGGFSSAIVGNTSATAGVWSPAAGSAFYAPWVGSGGFFLNEATMVFGAHSDYDISPNIVTGAGLGYSMLWGIGHPWAKWSYQGGGNGVTFAGLPSNAPDGSTTFCLDCTAAATCAGGGTGATATRINGAWSCGGGGGGSGAPTDAQYVALAANGTLTNERVLTPRDNLAATDAGAGGNYTVDFNPLDRSVAWFVDEFFGGTGTSNNIGDLGWTATGDGSVSVPSAVGTADRPWVITINSGATNGNRHGIYWGGGVGNGVNFVGWNSKAWEMQWIFRTGASVTSTSIQAGLCEDPTSGPGVCGGGSGAGFRLRFLAGTDAAWVVRRNPGGSDATSCTASEAPVADTWYRVVFSSASGSNVNVHLYKAGSATDLFSACSPTTFSIAAGLAPGIGVSTNESVQKTLSVDWFALKVRGLSR